MTEGELLVHIGYIREDIERLERAVVKNGDKITAVSDKVSLQAGKTSILAIVSGAISGALIQFGLKK